jgi:hypothetical protein
MQKQQADSELLKEGCRSYHKALFAVMQFRSEVRTAIQAAIDERIDDMSEALQLDKGDFSAGLTSYADPANVGQNWNGSEASVGLKYPARDYEARWGVYFYFWIGDTEEACACASCWFRDPDRPIAKLASLATERMDTSRSSAWISEPLAENTNGLSGALGRVLDRWIELWRNVGGIRQFLPAPRSRPAEGGA